MATGQVCAGYRYLSSLAQLIILSVQDLNGQVGFSNCQIAKPNVYQLITSEESGEKQ